MVNQTEHDRAFRIALRIQENQKALAALYEHLVDREFDSAAKELRRVEADMKLIRKSMEDDDF